MWTEIHVFEGRTYVTSTWGMSGGVAVADGISDAELGGIVAAHVIYDVGTNEFSEAERRRKDAWCDFCTRVAGVPVARFRPEKRVRAYGTSRGWTVDRKPSDMDAPGTDVPRTAGLAGLGAAVRRELTALDPRWPAVRQVLVATSSVGKVAVFPLVGSYWSGPCRVVSPGDDVDAFGATLSAALTDSDTTTRSDYSLADVGLDEQLLAGGARVYVRELSDGGVDLGGYGHVSGTATERRMWSGRISDMPEVCQAVLDMLATLPTRHLPPGTPAGESFGYKCGWLAIRHAAPDDVAAAIDLANTQEIGWREGVDAAYRGGVFVSPPTSGWVFVVGTGLLEDAPDIADLSARLGTEVQLFRTHRVSEHHEWALARDGHVVRHLRCMGMTGEFRQTGVPTPIEIQLGIPDMTIDDWHINEHTVMQVAAGWGIDPCTLDTVESSSAVGVTGRL